MRRVSSISTGRRLGLIVPVLLMVSVFSYATMVSIAQTGIWEDLFDDETKISQKMGTVVSGGDVSLGSGNMDWYRHGVLLDVGPVPSSFENSAFPEVLKCGDGLYRMWYTGLQSGSPIMERIRLATSVDGVNWDRMGVVIGPNASQEDRVYAATVIEDGGLYKMWYSGDDFESPWGVRIFYATSPDGYTWTRQGVAIPTNFNGGYDSWASSFPTVMKEGGVYKMWYSGYDTSAYRLLYATSSDGVSWTPGGLVMDKGANPSDLDYAGVVGGAIAKDASGTYHFWYTGSDGSVNRILNATSLDGIIWTKQGLSLDLIPSSTEEFSLSTGSVQLGPSSTVRIWYGAGDDQLNVRVHLATYTRSGFVISEEIGVGAGDDWDRFFSNKTDPSSNLLVTFSVLDSSDWTRIPGYWNLGTSTFSLAGIDALAYPKIRMRADLWDLVNNAATTPLVHDWAVTWIDMSPPGFLGLESAVDDQNGGNVTLLWSAASDPSTPILYNVYIATASSGQDFGNANYTTFSLGMQVTGLTNGLTHYFVVRAEDANGNEEINTVEMSAMPTTPIDSTAPDFSGIESASDAGTGGSVNLGWSDAMDPDTVECNTDPSLPISYNVYYSQTSSGQSFNTPDATTASLITQISGLMDGVTYYFVVRAEDSAGNEEGNLVELSAMPTTPIDTTPPQFSGLLSATDQGTSGNILLTWSDATDPDTVECNSDPSTPIQYNIYYSTISGGQDFSTPDQTATGTQAVATGLENGVVYYFVVRAEDAAGNEDDNIIEHIAIPTTPVDTTPPTFGGITNVVVDDDSGDVTLVWNVAIDPDEPECNSDPSNPIIYNIYMSEIPGVFDFNQPTASTSQQQHPILNLERGVTYYFTVRAEDAAGNEESNTVSLSGTVAVQGGFDILDWLWLFLIIIVIVVVLIVVLVARRRKDREEPPVIVESAPQMPVEDVREEVQSSEK